MDQLTPESRFALPSRYSGKKLKEIPNDYWIWLSKQDWFAKSKFSYEMSVKEYIETLKLAH